MFKLYPNGIRHWYNAKGDFHRLGGPAITWPNGSTQWWVNGQLHREEGPAVELAGGYTAWYLRDKLHRVNGPAVTHPDGLVEYWLEGKFFFSYEAYKKASNDYLCIDFLER
jgi:hypothetical protein